MRKLEEKEIIRRFQEIHGNRYNYILMNYINAKLPIKIICPLHGEFNQLVFNHLNGQGCPKCSGQYPYTTETFIQKANIIHSNKFSYLKAIYINNYTKLTITCPIHGDFDQTPFGHLQGQGCFLCGNKNKGLYLISNTQEFITKSNKIHNDKYNYEKTNYINNYTKVCITCKRHGDFLQVPGSHLSGAGCPVCKSSKGEKIIKNILKNSNIVTKPQYRIPDEKYLLKYDFYLPEYNLLIEFHGRQHYEWVPYFHKTEEKFKEAQQRDVFKIELAKLKNIPLIVFNHTQLTELTKKEFEELILFVIYKHCEKHNRKVKHVNFKNN